MYVNKEKEMSFKEMFEQMDDGVYLHNSISMDFSLKGFGFGQIYFYAAEDENGKKLVKENGDQVIRCQNECMSKETLKRILIAMVDQCELEDERD